MSLLQIYLITGLALLTLMTLVWLASLILKNTGIVDIIWGLGFVLSNWLYFVLAPGLNSPRQVILNVLVTIWGLRLSGYILWRNWGKPEDFRYRKWRIEAGNTWWWYSFFQTFLLQGFLMWVISIPLLTVHYNTNISYLTALDFIAICTWGIGFFFESVGDFQLARFKADPENRGRVLDTGLWHYTRHPNYFGDAVQWWSYYLFALISQGFWTAYSPILMTLLLLNVSGVTLLERTLRETKPQYQDYIETTNAFIPWLPRKKQ